MRLLPRTIAGTFLRIGNTTFGGGDPTIVALQRELVENRHALTQEEHGVVYALSRITPGTNMLAYCAGTGWYLAGWLGSLIAVAAVTIPSAVLAVGILTVFDALMKKPGPAAAIAAMIAAAVGLMFAGAWVLLRPHLTRRSMLRTLVIAAGAFLLAWKNYLSPFQVLLVAGLVGLAWPEFERE